MDAASARPWVSARHLEESNEGALIVDCNILGCEDPTHLGGTIADSASWLDNKRPSKVSERSYRMTMLGAVPVGTPSLGGDLNLKLEPRAPVGTCICSRCGLFVDDCAQHTEGGCNAPEAPIVEEVDSVDSLIAEVKALDAKATKGPWQECRHDSGGCQCGLIWSIPVDALVAECRPQEDVPHPELQQRKDNAALIARYRTVTPLLAAEVERLNTELSKAKEEARH